MENNRQTTYLIVVKNKADKFALPVSIEEATEYVKKYKDRKAVLVTRKNDDFGLDKIHFNQVQSFGKGKFRVVDKRDNYNHDEIMERILFGLKNGLIIVDDMEYSEPIMQSMLTNVAKNQDIIVHRNKLMLAESEVNYLNNQIRELNSHVEQGLGYTPEKRIMVRLHFDIDFKVNKETFHFYVVNFGKERGWVFFLCQYILFKKRLEYRQALDKICKEKGEKFEDYIDTYHFNKDTSNYIYIDLLTFKIHGNINRESIKIYQQELVEFLNIK
jgi:hypothetical protein